MKKIDSYDDFDDLEGENEFKLNQMNNLRFNVWYNVDNFFNEILYFYKYNKKERIYSSVSVGYARHDKDIIMIKQKDFYHSGEDLQYDDGTYEIQYIEFEELELSDVDSLRTMMIDIFEAKEIINDENALSMIK